MTTMRLELFKQEDCRAEYTCHVTGSDSLGREIVRTSHLLQQPPTQVVSDTAGQEGWTPTVAMHLVDLAQQLNTNMELMRSAMEDYRDRMTGVEDKVAGLETSVVTLEKGINDIVNRVELRFRDKLDLLEDKVTGLEKELSISLVRLEKGFDDNANTVERELGVQLGLFENRMSDKVGALEKELYKVGLSQEGFYEKIEDKFNQQEEKICTMEKELVNKINEIGDSQSYCGSFEKKLEQQMKDLLKVELLPLGLNLSKLSEDFDSFESSVENRMEQNIESLKQELQKCESVLDQASPKSAEKIVSLLNYSLGLLEESMDGHFHELSTAINESSIETRSAVHRAVSGTKVTDSSEVISTLTDVCKRGMVSLPTQPGYPYPVIQPSDGGSVNAPHLCDTVTDGGGWIIIQRRTTGNVDFLRNWDDYKTGFGTLDDDFWLGNDNIHAISSGDYELRVELRYNGKSAYAHYDKFAIADESGKYAISLGSYDGTAGDSLTYHAGSPFSTSDRDNDSNSGINCAVKYTGAWWHKHCHYANLNGQWGAGKDKGPRWSHFSGTDPVSFSEMKIRKLIKCT